MIYQSVMRSWLLCQPLCILYLLWNLCVDQTWDLNCYCRNQHQMVSEHEVVDNDVALGAHQINQTIPLHFACLCFIDTLWHIPKKVNATCIHA